LVYNQKLAVAVGVQNFYTTVYWL